MEGHGNMETKVIIKISYYSAMSYILYEICLRIHVMSCQCVCVTFQLMGIIDII